MEKAVITLLCLCLRWFVCLSQSPTLCWVLIIVIFCWFAVSAPSSLPNRQKCNTAESSSPLFLSRRLYFYFWFWAPALCLAPLVGAFILFCRLSWRTKMQSLNKHPYIDKELYRISGENQTSQRLNSRDELSTFQICRLPFFPLRNIIYAHVKIQSFRFHVILLVTEVCLSLIII